MRLIDADALINDVDGDLTDGIAEGRAIEKIMNAPVIEAVEVVRCKDCKHRDPEDRKCDCGHGILWQLPRDDDWFCADGERREE